MNDQTLAMRIVDLVEKEVNNRRGLHWDVVDDDILQEMKEDLAERIQGLLSESGS